MKLSIHKTQGKATQSQLKTLGNKWENIECTWEQAFDLITVQGFATSAELWNDKRCDANFVSRQLCMIDIDDGMTIQELLQDPFYNEYGAGFYTTPSHTDDHHRFRIIFRLEQAETNKQRYKHIIKGLLMYYQSADTSCSDASRLYYGTPNCEIFEFTDKMLLDESIDGLVYAAKEREQQEIAELQNKSLSNTTKHEYDTEFVDSLLRRIQGHTGSLRGEYNTWIDIAWAVCNTVGVQNAIVLMMRYWPDKTKREINTINSFKPGQAKHTIGTLVHLSKISNPDLYKLEQEFKIRNGLLTQQELAKQFNNSYKSKANIKQFNKGE